MSYKSFIQFKGKFSNWEQSPSYCVTQMTNSKVQSEDTIDYKDKELYYFRSE